MYLRSQGSRAQKAGFSMWLRSGLESRFSLQKTRIAVKPNGMSVRSKVRHDEAALVAFPPDGSRATFLCARMIERLAQSVEEIVQGCSPHIEFEESVARLPQRIRASSRVAPEVYCIYFDLLQAVRRDDLDPSAR